MSGSSLEAQALAQLDRGAAVRLVKAAASPVAVRLVRGDAVTLEPVRWLFPGYLPAGMLAILGGPAGCGKTTIAGSFAATVTTAGRWPDGSRCREPGDVLIWSGEDAHAVIAARLVAAGADMRRVHFIDGITGDDGGAFDPGRDMALLEATAEGLPAPRLLILDPIVSAVSGDGHKSNDVRRALQPVVDLAQRLGCAVLGITHFSKGTTGRDPVERITGSLAFAALARLVLVAAKVKADADDSEPRRVLVRAKSNIGPDDGGFAYALERVEVAPEVEGQRVQWLEALQGSAREVLADAEAEPSDEDGDSPADVESFVRACLASGPIPAKVFKADVEGAGYQWRTVQRAAKRIGAESRKDGMQGGWRWGFHGTPKATNRTEGVEDASTQTVSPLTPSTPCVSPSVDAEVF
ncbi:MAG: AAA family ATPase [Burkholderiaceae bacterium]|nr:AAA family ATPase [Burkholderiaceae bacterium]